MKNIFIKSFFLISSILILIKLESCDKVQLRTSDLGIKKNMMTMLGVGDTANIYNYVWIANDKIITPNDSGFRISALAAFTDSITHQIVSVNNLSINARTLTPNTDNSYSFIYSDSATGALQEGKNLYGTNVKIKITGTTTSDTVTQTLYMPKRVFSSITDYPTGQIDISTNLTLKWIADPACSWGNVAIKIWYNAGRSRFISDSTLPANDTVLSYIVPDNGSYTINLGDLQKLRVNSLVTFSLGRGSTSITVLPISKKRIFYYTSSSVSSIPQKLICSANWQNTGLTQCQVNGSGFNTGYQLVQQKDLSTCSPTYNQTQWVTGSYNLSACPLPASIQGYDSKTISYRVAFTNTSTNTVYNFVLNANTNTYYSVGQIPNGNYNVTFNGIGQPTSSTFYANGYTQYGLSASFTNIPFTATSNINVH